jgi:hypothetical protein
MDLLLSKRRLRRGVAVASGAALAAGVLALTASAASSASPSPAHVSIASAPNGIAGLASCSTHTQLLGNPGFETRSAAPWSGTPAIVNQNGAGETAHSGTWYAWLDGYGTIHTDTLSQTVTIPAGCTGTSFSFWLHIDTAETTTTTAFDKLTITANGTTIATFSNLDHIAGYLQHTYSLGNFAGSTVTVKFTGTEDVSLQTSFVVDDAAINPN